MKPKSLSASAVHVFESCPARYVGESFRRTPNSSGSAADLGSAAHNALERWCLSGQMRDPKATLDELTKIFDEEYDRLFGYDDGRKDEGRELIETWYKRTHPIEHEILSAEVKENFPITVTHDGEQITVPFNYIMDRVDRLPDGDIDVVDYKTISFPLNHEMMRRKIQVRAYGLAARIKYPEAKRHWVTYDMLRHGDPVGVSFDRDDCADTYRYLQNVLRRVLAEDANKPTETINEECRWCIRKQVCGSLRKHADVGGVHAITDPKVAAQRRHKMQQVQSALSAAIAELDGVLMNHMQAEDVLEFDADGVVVEASAQRRRNVDPVQVRRVLPDDLWDEYGAANITMKALDKLLKDDRLTQDQKQQVKGLVTFTFSNPSIKTRPAHTDEDE